MVACFCLSFSRHKDTSRRKPFKCKPPEVLFTIRSRVPYKQLTSRTFSSHTGEYWPLVVAVWTSLRSVRTATTSGQYFRVRPSRSVSKRLILWLKSCKELIYVLFFMSSTTKSPFLAVLTWFLIPGKIQDRRQDGDLCWWRQRPPAAPPSIKYNFSC